MKAIRTILIFLGICFLLYALMFIFVVSGAFVSFIPSSPRPIPTVTYGEFSCRLEYELDGETKVIEDVIICKYAPFNNRGLWKQSLKSGDEHMTLLDLRPLNIITETGNQLLELYFAYGSAEYYMENGDGRDALLDMIGVIYVTPDGIVGGSGYTPEEAWEEYKIRLISWESDPPIENSFIDMDEIVSGTRDRKNLF